MIFLLQVSVKKQLTITEQHLETVSLIFFYIMLHGDIHLFERLHTSLRDNTRIFCHLFIYTHTYKIYTLFIIHILM